MRRLLVGDDPRALLFFLGPTALGLLVDLVLRARALAGYALQGKAIYGSSLLVSAGFWILPLWTAARLHSVQSRSVRQGALAALAGLWILPLATFCYGGQVLYHRVFASYMGRDTLRLGIALRGTVGGWFDAWGGPWLMAAMLAGGALVTWGALRSARAASSRVRGGVPAIAVVVFAGALVCFWSDNVDSRFLQAATPDACFVHGCVHALRMAITGQWHRRQGVSLRTPAALPSDLATARKRPPDVLLVMTESVRADAMCSDPPPGCRDPYLDESVGDRLALGRTTSQTPNTFSASVLLWTGVAPT
ncbi:MAG TPA: hypothetical protein VF765_21825, partial [Polyangiaceae bacterium]